MADIEALIRAVQTALDRLEDPKTGQGLITSGRVQGVAARDNGRVSFIVEADGLGPLVAGALRDAAVAAVQDVSGVSEALAVLTAERTGEAPLAPGSRRVRKGARLSDEAIAQNAPRQAGLLPPIPGVAAIVAVASAKGGVGKSTVAVNLACALSQRGLSVGLLDADIYGPSAPLMTGTVDASPEALPDKSLIAPEAWGLKVMSIGHLVDPDAPMIWRGPIVMSALTQLLNDVAWAPLDILILDTPPGTGDALLTLAQRVPLDGAVIVSTPQEAALADVRRGVAMFRKTQVPILGIVENMAYFEQMDGTKAYIFGEGGAKKTAKTVEAPFLGELPLDQAVREGGDAGAPITAAQPESASAQRFLRLADRFLDALDAARKTQKPAPEIVFE